MKAGLVFCAASLLLLTGASRSFAQADTAQFEKFIFSESHRSLITRALDGLPQAVFRRCPALVSNGSQVTVVKPVTIAASGLPNGGMWRESFPVTGCGNDTTLNFYFTADSNEKIKTLIALPGATRADLVLQNDAYKYAAAGATVAARTCKAFYVKDTSFDGFGLINPPQPDPGPGQRYRPWHETWILTGCDRTFAVAMSFVPSETGTDIIVPAGGVVER
jgi:hypothetical protein